MTLPGEQARYAMMAARESKTVPLPPQLSQYGSAAWIHGYGSQYYPASGQASPQTVPQQVPSQVATTQTQTRTVVRRYIQPGLWPGRAGAAIPGLMPGPAPGMGMPIPMRAPSPRFPSQGLGRIREWEPIQFDEEEPEFVAPKLVFWPKSAVMAYITSGVNQTVWTRFLSTEDFLEVVAHLEVDGEVAPNSSISVTPEVSSDGSVWDSLSSFTSITPGGAYPKTEVVKCSTVASLMRFRITLSLSSGSSLVGATLGIFAVGKPEE